MDREPRVATSTFTQLLNSEREREREFQCCFTSIETIRTIVDREPRVATSTFTQLLSSERERVSMLLYVHRDHKDYYGRGAQGGHLDSRTVPLLP